MSSLALSDQRDTPVFTDGLGERVVAADGTTGEPIHVLRLRPDILAVPSFEFALRERTARLANFRHPYFARVRRIDRGISAGPTLSVVSDQVEGTRLSEILRVAAARGLRLDTAAALCLVRQLVPAVAVLHENARDVAHGLIAPERLVVTPGARLVVVEHVLGAAIEQLQYPRERLWQEFRAGLPATAGPPRFNHRADVNAIGLVSLALLLGRPLEAAEFPQRIPVLLAEVRERSTPAGDWLSPALGGWLARALQIDPRRAFASAPEALAALEAIGSEGAPVASAVALEAFLSQYVAAALDPAPSPFERHAAQPGITIVSPAAPAPEVPAAPVQQADCDLQRGWPDAAAGAEAKDLDTTPLAPHEQRAGGGRRRLAAVLAVVAVIATSGGVAWRMTKSAAAVPAGVLAVQSSPPGVLVVVDGVERGVTPARVSLAPGAHILELRGRGVPRVVPFNVTPGAEVSQYLEFVEAPVTGRLVVQSDPPGARVSLDGIGRGVTPLTVADLAPGDHTVVLAADQATSQHTVAVQAGGTVSLVVPLAARAGPVSGWLSLQAPFTIEVWEGGRLLGTSDTDRIMMAAGSHDLELVSDAMAYRARRTVQVPAGKVAPFALELPQGTVNLNAMPWAEVWLDGKVVGETPIGNLAVPIGPHEIVFKHPQLGERRQAVSVTLAAPVRVSVDMR